MLQYLIWFPLNSYLISIIQKTKAAAKIAAAFVYGIFQNNYPVKLNNRHDKKPYCGPDHLVSNHS